MLRAQYRQGKSAACTKFAAPLSPQEEQAFGYGNAEQRALQVHGVAGQHAPGVGGVPHEAFNQAQDAQLRASAAVSGTAQTKPHNLDPTNKLPAPGATQTGVLPKDGGGTSFQPPSAGAVLDKTDIKQRPQGPQAPGGAGGTRITAPNATRVGPAPMNIKAPAAGGKPAQHINTPGPGMGQQAAQLGRRAMQFGQKAMANPWARGAALVGGGLAAGGLAAGGLAGHLMTGNSDDRR